MNVDARAAAGTHATAPASHIDADPRDNVIACRNMLAGLWAGRLMQLLDNGVQRYAATLHQVGLNDHGQDDVVEKLFGDLNRCGVAITREEVRRKLCEFHCQAYMQTRETD